MKNFLILLLCTIVHVNASALGGYPTLEGDAKRIADVVISNLEISEEDSYELYENVLKTYFDTKDWHFDHFSNNTLTASKVTKSSDRTLLLNIVTEDRLVNISMTKFAVEKQVLIQAIETLPRSSQTVLKKYAELKKDKSYAVSIDKPEFSTFEKPKTAIRVKTMVNGSNGAIQYVDMFLRDLKK